MTEKVTRIEIKEKGTKEFYKEVVSVTNQYLGLIKKPDRKLRDSFGQLKGYIVLCAICFAVPLIMGIAWDNVAFVREFNESVCFFSKSVQGLILAVSKTYRQQVFDHLRDNSVNVRIIER